MTDAFALCSEVADRFRYRRRRRVAAPGSGYSARAPGHYRWNRGRAEDRRGGGENMGEPMGPTATQSQAEFLRLFIWENNADLALTLTLLLNAEPDIRCVVPVSSTTAVLGALEAHSPNAFVLDLSLDDGSSLPLIATLRARAPRAVIVVYTGHKNQMLDEHCLRCGADAVVLKSGDIDTLTAALHQAALHPRRA